MNAALRSTLDVGILGLGPAWESRYRSALLKLRDRIRVRCVYDAVTNRAQFAAEEFGASVALGIQALISRPDVRAILYLDSSWYGHIPLHHACQFGKPVYIGTSLGDSLDSLEQLQQKVAEQGLDFMPEFSRRYAPATGRLRELLATRLGRPRTIHLRSLLSAAHPAAGHETESGMLMGLIDWCQYVIGTSPTSILSLPAELAGSQPDAQMVRQILVQFRASASDGQTSAAQIDVLAPRNGHHPQAGVSTPRLNGDVGCARGLAVVEGADLIRWGANGHLDEESLVAERSDVEVMLDHFCRRVVGGLIPVPSIQDVCRTFTLVDAANESHRLGHPVPLRE